MKYVACIKQVPAVENVDFDPETGRLKRESVQGMLNPFDAYALELALALKDIGGGELTAITMGPPQAEDVLRDALAMGVDSAVLIADRALAGCDTLATSLVLAEAVKKLGGAEVVVCGRESADGETGQVGPEISVLLGYTCCCYVSEITEISEGAVTARRLTDRGVEVVAAGLPAVVTVTRGAKEPRPPSLRGMMAARKAEITTWGLSDLGLDECRVGAAGSPTQVTEMCVPELTRSAELLEGPPEKQAGELLVRLRSGGLL